MPEPTRESPADDAADREGRPVDATPPEDAAPSPPPGSDAELFDPLKRFLRHVPKGARIFDQGDQGRTMFFIQEGRVRITKVSARRKQPLAVLEAGSFFGEMAVLNGEPRSARAEAITDGVLLEIDRSTVDAFLDAHPEVAKRMIRTLAERLRDTDALVERMLEGDPAIQVVEAIIELVDDVEEDPPYIADVHTLMVQSATDPTLLRWILSRLKRGRFISIDEKGIRVGQLQRLKQYHNFLRMQQDFLSA